MSPLFRSSRVREKRIGRFCFTKAEMSETGKVSLARVPHYSACQIWHQYMKEFMPPNPSGCDPGQDAVEQYVDAHDKCLSKLKFGCLPIMC